MNTIEIILAQMSKIYKPQRQFLVILLTTWMCLRGKANFRLVVIAILMKRPIHAGFAVTLILLSSTAWVLLKSATVTTH